MQKIVIALALFLPISPIAQAEPVFKINAQNLESFNMYISAVDKSNVNECTAFVRGTSGSNQGVAFYYDNGTLHINSRSNDKGVLLRLKVTLKGGAVLWFPGMCDIEDQPDLSVVNMVRDIKLDHRDPTACTKSQSCDNAGHCSFVNGTQYFFKSIEGMMDEQGHIINWDLIQNNTACL